MTPRQIEPLLANLLAERISPGQPTIIHLTGDPIVFRLSPSAGRRSGLVTSDALAHHEPPWRSVGRLSRLVGPLTGQMGPMGDMQGWAHALLPFLTVAGGNWAARLAEQMGGRSALPMRRKRLGPRFRAQYQACLNDAEQARRLLTRITNSLAGGLKRPPDGCPRGDRPAMLRLESNQGRVRATWLSANGRQLCRETLGELIHRVCSSPSVVRLIRQASRVESRQGEHRAAGEAHLQEACPKLAEALAHALRANRCVGHWILSASVRGGLSADVYLYIDPAPPGRPWPRVSLVARRAHEEFVLGNARGDFFYFPPVQLAAQIDFTAGDPPWFAIRPYVRMPASHPAWRHPYTGSLKTDWFSKAEMLSRGKQEAMVAVSREARRILMRTPKHHATHQGGASDLCLRGQDLRIDRLVQASCGRGWGRREADLFWLVRELWDMVRVGLTRAHEDNIHIPRLPLKSEFMPYPISGAAPLRRAKLAGRVFPYYSQVRVG